LVFVIKFIAEQGLAFRDDENVGSPRRFFQKICKAFFKQKEKKDVMLLATGLATVLQIANPCQIPCCIIKFVAVEHWCRRWKC